MDPMLDLVRSELSKRRRSISPSELLVVARPVGAPVFMRCRLRQLRCSVLRAGVYCRLRRAAAHARACAAHARADAAHARADAAHARAGPDDSVQL
jgi:hypothetical protein